MQEQDGASSTTGEAGACSEGRQDCSLGARFVEGLLLYKYICPDHVPTAGSRRVSDATGAGHPNQEIRAGKCGPQGRLSSLSAPQSLLHLPTMHEQDGAADSAGESCRWWCLNMHVQQWPVIPSHGGMAVVWHIIAIAELSCCNAWVPAVFGPAVTMPSLPLLARILPGQVQLRRMQHTLSGRAWDPQVLLVMTRGRAVVTSEVQSYRGQQSKRRLTNQQVIGICA